MNRYVIEGIVRDVAAGARVVYVGTSREVDFVLLSVVGEAGLLVRKVRRSYGGERIEFESGGVLRFARSESALRGFDADVVYIGDSKRDSRDLVQSAYVAVNASRGEVIIA